MSQFECYQAAGTTHVVWSDAPDHSAVTISRAVGNPRARALMRLCNDVLNGDMLQAQAELDDLSPLHDGGDAR